MMLKMMGLRVGVAAMAVAAGACNTEDPERQCSVARAVSDGSTGSFASTFTLKEEASHPDRPCTLLKSEPVGLQKYFSREPAAPDTVAIRTDRMGRLVTQYASRVDPASAGEPYAAGALASESPGPDNFCDVPELSPARLEVPATSSLPAQSFAYEWSNLRVYNTPEIPGTQFVADLRYMENGCTAEYSVKGIWPVVSCATAGKPDEAKCDPYPDFNVGRLRGSGINPIFPVKCDPVALICVLTGEVPSDKKP
ncbi:hypothetical protein [Hyalangium sp.]|uniref:hypothetical protein n=1 Tax=Hyalangium sp. TaxID=2028555 RepID=UPI002D2A5239|nr:hypothetical protein [Hyalangium sp.]HYI02258.1 hypothetical protein [Hyalangium sp.]